MATYKRIDGDYVITTINSNDSILLVSDSVEIVSPEVEVSGNLTVGGAVVLGNVVIGNITAGNISGNIITADQPYITSLGILTELDVAGSLTAVDITAVSIATGNLSGNITTANQPGITGLGNLTQLISVGNIISTGGFYFGDGRYLSNVVANVGEASILANGLSQVNIPIANGSIRFDIDTTANVMIVDTTGISVQGIIQGDLQGSVFAEDSSVLVDAITSTHYGAFVGDLRGSVFADDSAVIVDAINNEITVGSLNVLGEIQGVGDITTVGNITGNYFFGNGSQLTGIDATSIQFGNSRVKVVSSGGNIIANVSDITIQTWHTGGVDILGNVAANVVDIDTTAASNPAYREGRLFYDTTLDAMAYYNSVANVVLAIGQDLVQRVINDTGSTMIRGQVVYLTGADITGVPTVELAQADNFNTCYNTLGLITANIAPGGAGMVQTYGLIEAVDTSAFSVGDILYVSPSTAGNLVAVSPTFPYFSVQVGLVLVSDATNGSIYFDLVLETAETFRSVGDARFDADVTVAGNLAVIGTTTTTLTNNLEVANSFIYLGSGDTIGPSGTTFTGSGLNDGVFVGHYTGSGTTSYYVKIDGVGTGNAGVDTFAWSLNNFVSNVAVNVDITGSPQLLANSISIEFNATTGHTLNDEWSGNAAPTNLQIGIVGNYNTGTYAYTGLFRNTSTGVWAFFQGYTPEPQGNINITDPSYELAPLQANVIYATTFSGNGSAITNINGANITGAINVATANISGGNIAATGNISASYFIGNGSQLSGIDATSIQSGTSSMRVLTSGGDIAANIAGNVVGTFNSSGLGVIGITNANANGVGNIGNSTTYFNTVFAKATSAQYADLAELYLADGDYGPGTVMEFGGEQEITICDTANSHRVAGVVSENPAHVMNAGLTGDHVTKLALIGRVRCLVHGPVRSGDILVSDTHGWARVNNDAAAGRIIGKSLANSDQDGYVEIVVGKH